MDSVRARERDDARARLERVTCVIGMVYVRARHVRVRVTLIAKCALS